MNMSYGNIEEKKFDAAGLRTLKIKNLSGDIKVLASDNKKILVSLTKKRFDKSCSLKMGRNGKSLEIEVKSKGWSLKDQCEVFFSLTVPKTIDLEVNSGSGDFKCVRY